jgi:hypothetical protein
MLVTARKVLDPLDRRDRLKPAITTVVAAKSLGEPVGVARPLDHHPTMSVPCRG